AGQRMANRLAQRHEAAARTLRHRHKPERGVQVRVPRRDEWDDGLAPPPSQLLELPPDRAAHRSSLWPSRAAASLASLSPRPDRFTITTVPSASAGPRRRTSATACALSRAGMIPSSRLSVWKAASASASETDVYSTRPTSCRYACSGPTLG